MSVKPVLNLSIDDIVAAIDGNLVPVKVAPSRYVVAWIEGHMAFYSPFCGASLTVGHQDARLRWCEKRALTKALKRHWRASARPTLKRSAGLCAGWFSQ